MGFDHNSLGAFFNGLGRRLRAEHVKADHFLTFGAVECGFITASGRWV